MIFFMKNVNRFREIFLFFANISKKLIVLCVDYHL